MLSAKEKRDLERSYRHPCTLTETDNVLVRHISTGYFVDFRRKLKVFMMCSEKNPRTKLFLKSSASLNFEKVNHLRYYYWMVHPYSLAKMVWELFMTATLIISLIYVPIEACILQETVSATPKAVLDFICFLDIICSFLTGFHHSLTKRIVMNPRDVAKNYIKTWFFIDVVAIVNFDALSLIFSISSNYPYVWLLRVPGLFRICHLLIVLKYLDRIWEWTHVVLYKCKLIKLSLIVATLILWNTCLLYVLAGTFKESWFPHDKSDARKHGVQICFLRIVTSLLLVGHGERDSSSWLVIIAEMVWLASGFILQLFITGQLAQIVLKYSSLTDKYYEILQQFREYMSSKNLPTRVQKRVFDYFQFRFHGNFYKEREILSTFSKQLKEEVIFHVGKQMLKDTLIFGDLPESLLVTIVRGMTLEVYLPNDVVVTAGSRTNYMYFICTGMVAVYGKNGKEICHLRDGSSFGEAALFLPERGRAATVIASDYCEMYALSHDCFMKAVSPYPEILERIVKICIDRFQAFKNDEEFTYSIKSEEERTSSLQTI